MQIPSKTWKVSDPLLDSWTVKTSDTWSGTLHPQGTGEGRVTEHTGLKIGLPMSSKKRFGHHDVPSDTFFLLSFRNLSSFFSHLYLEERKEQKARSNLRGISLLFQSDRIVIFLTISWLVQRTWWSSGRNNGSREVQIWSVSGLEPKYSQVRFEKWKKELSSGFDKKKPSDEFRMTSDVKIGRENVCRPRSRWQEEEEMDEEATRDRELFHQVSRGLETKQSGLERRE